jgi:hypothetical protein
LRSLVVLSMLLAGCASTPQPTLWSELQSLCGKAFEGRLVEGTEPSDADIGRQRLVMHVRECSDSEIRIPFHVGENRSRTWVITRTDGGLRLKHDHRHEDGSPDRITQYGGDSSSAQLLQADFPADTFTGSLIPASATNVWTMAIDPGRSFTYTLRRANRRFRVEFDLTREVPAPPPPWQDDVSSGTRN